ncbi:MAG: tRNA uridine-5-carboxymethylaminomethyl(34) synthesis GTPase MnmE [Clostridia bacterium]|nr:tRNA uridine-5-carboxymethylaminomethyl(34) synthesis GTPase MnmE [Clostridia bacterium]
MTTDTIAAIATAPGQGGIGIVRISGPDAGTILRKVFRKAGKEKETFENRRMYYGRIYDGDELLDECLAVLMRGPGSYTGEDVAELQLHGGGYVLQRVMETCIANGARPAGPGEFTRRAFLNGRIDLTQAEAVMSMISASGEQAHRAAARQLDGGTATFIRKASERLYQLRAGLAACVDYPEEVTDEEAVAELLPATEKLADDLEAACDERSARIAREGLHVVFYGRPNVGKSSLLNALLGEERAIVTPIPGTTRDTVTGELQLAGVRVHLTDTAGMRESSDPVEKIGVERTEKALKAADIPVLVLDAHQPPDREELEMLAKLPENGAVLLNKQDLTACAEATDAASGKRVFECCAVRPETLDTFRNWIRECASLPEQMVMTDPRHIHAAREAVRRLRAAADTMRAAPPDLAEVDLLAAQNALASVTGEQADEKLLDAVFSSFCVGK